MAIPIIGFAGFSGSGKTTLIEKLIPALKERGVRTAVIKHDAHGLKFDCNGKDSARFASAGADYSIVNGPGQTAIFIQHQLTVEEAAAKISNVDLILIEGYKYGSFPQIGVSRKENGKDFPLEIAHYKALVTDREIRNPPVPLFGFGDIDAIADFLIEMIEQYTAPEERNN